MVTSGALRCVASRGSMGYHKLTQTHTHTHTHTPPTAIIAFAPLTVIRPTSNYTDHVTLNHAVHVIIHFVHCAEFTFVTSGIRRKTLTGEATIELFPHMKGLEDCAGVASCITTEVVTSQHRSFPMITFVDTPGLIDGDAKYPYDIDAALLWLGRMADVVLVFFDPIGQVWSTARVCCTCTCTILAHRDALNTIAGSRWSCRHWRHPNRLFIFLCPNPRTHSLHPHPLLPHFTPPSTPPHPNSTHVHPTPRPVHRIRRR
jgi:hypothetical protein